MEVCQKWKPVIVILTAYFVMAVLNLLFKMVLNEGKTQLVIVNYRLLIAAVFLTPIAYFCERTGIRVTASILCQLFFSALIGATLSQYLFLLGIKCTSAAFGTAFTNMTPVLTFLLALLLRQESVNLRSKGGIAKVVGTLICMSGVMVMIFYRGVPLNKGSPHSNKSSHNANNNKVDSAQKWILGSVFLVSSHTLWSSWFLIQARIGKKYPYKYSSTAFMSFFGAIQSAILCYALNRDFTVWILTGKLQILTVLSAGILGSGLCYVAMAWCVEQRGPVFTAAFSPSIQIFIIILDFTFFHEQIYLGSIIGSMLVICGLYILLWGKSHEAVDSISKPAEAVECNGSSAIASNVT